MHYNRERCGNCGLLELGKELHKGVRCALSRRDTVKVFDKLSEVLVNGVAESCCQHRRHRHSGCAVPSAVVVNLIEVFDGKHECVVLTHSVDVRCPHIIKGFKYDRIGCVRHRLLGHTIVLQGCFLRRLVGLEDEVTGRFQREVNLLFEDIDAPKDSRHLVALLAHLGEVFLHSINILYLLRGHLSLDGIKHIQADLVAYLVGLDKLEDTLYLAEGILIVEEEATLLHMGKCLVTLGVSIDGHHML